MGRDWHGVERCYWPKALMFLSVDVVGSTALKQTRIPDIRDQIVPDNTLWFNVIQSFYNETVSGFVREFDRAVQFDRGRKPWMAGIKRPVFWKTIGDEVLFWMEVSDCRQVQVYLNAWIRVMDGLREMLRKSSPQLDVKCTAWVAQLPWRNKVIVSSRSGRGFGSEDRPDRALDAMRRFFEQVDQESVRAEDGDDAFCAADLVADFIGPGIDIGFRLAARATARRFIISADVAYMLATAEARGRCRTDFKVHYEGLQQLQGALGGFEYPIFWIDMTSGLAIDAYGRDLQQRSTCKAKDILQFCELFYDERSNYLYRPFLVSDTEDYLVDAPGWYAEAHLKMLREAAIIP